MYLHLSQKVNDTITADKVIDDIKNTLQTINKRCSKELNIKIDEKDTFILLTFIVDDANLRSKFISNGNILVKMQSFLVVKHRYNYKHANPLYHLYI